MSCSLMNIHGAMPSTWQTQVMAVLVLQMRSGGKRSRFTGKIRKDAYFVFCFFSCASRLGREPGTPEELSLAIMRVREKDAQVTRGKFVLGEIFSWKTCKTFQKKVEKIKMNERGLEKEITRCK